jgi:hypothetical protein
LRTFFRIPEGTDSNRNRRRALRTSFAWARPPSATPQTKFVSFLTLMNPKNVTSFRIGGRDSLLNSNPIPDGKKLPLTRKL